MSESDFKNNSQETAALSYWPALDEYNPGITADMWASVLDDDTVTSPKIWICFENAGTGRRKYLRSFS